MAVIIRNIDTMSSTITVVAIVLFASVCLSHLSFVEGNYFYHTSSNTNSYHRSKPSLISHQEIMHHKRHSNSGRLQQAAVGVVRGRLLPLTAKTATPAPTTTLSPLDLLMNKLDTMEKHSVTHNKHYDTGKRQHEVQYGGSHALRRQDPVPSALLRSSDHKYSHLRSRNEGSDEDIDEDEDEDEDDALDDNRDEEDDDDEDEEEEDEKYDRFGAGRHPHRSHDVHRGHKSSHAKAEDPWLQYDGVVADFPDQPSGSGSGSGSGRYNGYNSYSDLKWMYLNKPNMDKIRSQRERGGGSSVSYRAPASADDIGKAVEHQRRISRQLKCQEPKPRVIQVKEVHPHPSKSYIPHCTILHRCGDDTGCCSTDFHTCAPHKTEIVELYFYSTGLEASVPPQPEKLQFYNHTECSCVDRQQDLMPRDGSFPSTDLGGLGRSTFRGYHRHDLESSKIPSGSDTRCRCTSHFSPRRQSDGTCSCECFEKQRECIRLKKGKDYLTYSDRACVIRGDCISPTCEFGSYFRRQGRCPKKSEKFEAWQQYQHDEEYN